jgi:di/tricarboxylate transporter
VMSSTAVVAIFIPIVIRIAQETGLNRSRMLLPMSYAGLISGMLPLADALDVTGGTALIVELLMATAGDAGPYVMMSILFALTAGLGLVLSNTASAVLVAPIAIYAAQSLGVSPSRSPWLCSSPPPVPTPRPCPLRW